MDHQISPRILVVDDELGMREGCRRTLKAAGHQVDTAEDMASALDLIRTREYTLYLLDVMLPDGSGLELLAPITEGDPDAICIIITGFGSIEMAVEAVRRGAYNFLPKPFTSDQLLVAVNQGLERRRLKEIESRAEELAQAKEDLEQLDKIKSQLMLKLAHELRAPVAAVQSYVNLILSGYVSDGELKPTLHRVHERLQEMLDVISDLLQLARLKEARDQVLSEASPQSMANVLEEVIDLLHSQAEEKEQTLLVEIQDQPTIVANRDHLLSIWTNLISNAIKYTPKGGRIKVRLQADMDTLMGVVEDSGMGIPEEDIPHLFQEFFRTDEAKASGEMGTGLGLSIVKQILESYGGDIRVRSKVGEGTRFTFMLPLQPAAAEKSNNVTARPPLEPKPASRPWTDQSQTHARQLFLEDD
ncbi:MAG: hybrid sensor histidine kinase/response regulator [Anaerolineae bacterium]|jgi:signal transduction histidine kinase